jgi:hypothetical protein
MQQLGNDSTVKIRGAGAPTGPADHSISSGNAGMWLLHYLELETLENIENSAVQKLLAKLLMVGKRILKIGLLFRKVNHHHAASGCSLCFLRKKGWCDRA